MLCCKVNNGEGGPRHGSQTGSRMAAGGGGSETDQRLAARETTAEADQENTAMMSAQDEQWRLEAGPWR